MDALAQDLRYALRSWRRQPGPLVAALSALALGIAATTTVFSFVYAVLLKPLPFRQPDRLVMVWQDLRARGGPERDWLSPGLAVAWQQRAPVFDAIGVVRGWAPVDTGGSEPERLQGAAVSFGFFAALGVEPLLGRTFSDAEDRPGTPTVVVLSHALWTRRFAADRSLVGRSISLDGQPVTVVGVMPASFIGPIMPAEIWSAARLDPSNAPFGMITLRALARVKAGVPIAQAQAAMNTLQSQLAADESELNGSRVLLVPLLDDMVGAVRPILMVLLVAVGAVLLIACANVASVLVARAAERAREMTLRVTLGADRRRLIRQLLTESALLAAIGGAAGLALAIGGVRALVAAAPPASPRLGEVGIDVWMLGFTALISIGCAITAGLAPALAASRVQLTSSLRDGGREATRSNRSRALIVGVQVAAAMVLVVSAALLVRSLISLQRVDLGFDVDRVLTAPIAAPRQAYRSEDAMNDLYARLIDAIARVPGVESAGLTSVLPLSGSNVDFTFEIEGRPSSGRPGDMPVAWFRSISAGYFRAIGMTLTDGRAFADADRAGGPGVVIVNETLARRYWPGESPIGKRLSLNMEDKTIVGVVRDVHHRGPALPPDGEMYAPFTQVPARQMVMVARAGGREASIGSIGSIAPAIRAAIREIAPALPPPSITPLAALAARSVAQPRFLASLLTGFAAVAAALAVVGLYGLLSYAVTRRVREIGLRMALGASRSSVIALVLRQSLAVAGAGIAAGAALAVAGSRLLRSVLFGVEPGDPLVVIGVALALAGAAAVASYIPARRAAAIDPIVALRED